MPLLEYYNGTSWVQAGTVSSVTAGTGLSGGTITSSGTLNIAATGVPIGTYLLPTITVNAQGQITSASSVGAGSANQILKSNGVGGVWASYLSTPSAGSFCLTESNKSFSGVQNTAFGDGALNANTTGFYNTSVGNYALYKTTSGGRNTAVGQAALLNNVAGNSNCAFGESALLWNTGNSNSAFGSNALASNTSGYYNVAVGNESLTRNTTGFRNVALGYSSLFLCSTGTSNTAVGDLSSYGATTGYSNTSVGASSLYTASTGYDNSSFGALSSYFTTSGYRNCAFGRSALYANTTGYQNSAFGFGALSSNTTGNSNVAFGQNALDTNTTGVNNTAVGYAADVSASGLTNATAIGAYAVCGASNSIVLGGASSLNSVYYPNVGIGKDTPSYSLHVGNTRQTPISAIGIDNTINTPAALSTGAVIYASGGDLYAVTSNSGTQKIGTPQNLGTVTSVSISGSTGLTVSGSPITASGTISLTLGSELQGVSSLSSNGVVARTAAGVYTARTITAGTGISITNGNGVSGNPSVSVSNIPISSLASYPTDNGVFLRGDGTWSKPLINNLLITGDVNLSAYNLTTSGVINATTGTLKANNIASHNSTTINVSTPLTFSSSSSSSTSISLNNTNTLSTANDIGFLKNGVTYFSIGYNNSTDEAYVWAYGSAGLKFGTNGLTRAFISSSGQTTFNGTVDLGSNLLKTSGTVSANTLTTPSGSQLTVSTQLNVSGAVCSNSFASNGNTFIQMMNPINIGYYAPVYYSTYGYLNSGGNTGRADGTNYYSITAAGRISASEFNAISSINVKNVIDRSEEIYLDAYDAFNKINFVKYEYKDKVVDGGGIFYGVIAEELAEVLPDYVSPDMAYVPNILKEATVRNLTIGKYELICDSCIDLNVGDKLRLLNQKSIAYAEVIESNENGILVTCDSVLGDAVLIYGTFSNCPSVAKNKLFELSMLVVKDLAKRIERIESLL